MNVVLPILLTVVLIVVLVVTGYIPLVPPSDEPLLNIIIYTDLQCGPCGRLHSEVEPELRERYVATGKAQIETRLLAAMDPVYSMQAAQAALCGGDQGRFLEYMAALFEAYSEDEDPNVFSVEALTQLALDLGLDEATFAGCLNSEAKKAEAEENMSRAQTDGVRTLPALLVGNLKIEGLKPLDAYIKAIEEARRPGQRSVSGFWAVWRLRSKARTEMNPWEAPRPPGVPLLPLCQRQAQPLRLLRSAGTPRKDKKQKALP